MVKRWEQDRNDVLVSMVTGGEQPVWRNDVLVSMVTRWEQESCRELLQGGNRKRRPKIHFFCRLSKFSDCYANSPSASGD